MSGMSTWEIHTCFKNFVQVVKRGSIECVRSMVSSKAKPNQVENLLTILWMSMCLLKLWLVLVHTRGYLLELGKMRKLHASKFDFCYVFE